MGYKRISKSPFFVRFKKHYCPDCGQKLDVIKVSKIVNSRSPEAKHFDFHNVDNYMVGDVKFVWDEFECPECKIRFSIEAMKKIENN